ncbi:hypothetical protein D3C71_2216530 [compost metagenome]
MAGLAVDCGHILISLAQRQIEEDANGAVADHLHLVGAGERSGEIFQIRIIELCDIGP